MSEEQPRARPPSIGEGIRSGIGILAAFREAIEETIQEAVSRGDARPERAREVVNTAVDRMTAAFEEVRDRVDVVPRREFDALKAEVAELRRRLDDLAGGPATPGALPGDVGSPGVFEGGGPAGGGTEAV